MNRGLIGICHVGMHASCIAFLLLASLAHAQSAHDLNARGVEYYNAAKWERSISFFEQAYRADVENEVIRNNLSNAYQAYANDLSTKDKFKDAITNLEHVLKLDPSNAQPLIQLGAYYLHEGMIRDAIYRLEEAIELAPGNTDAHFLLGESYYKDNDVTAALDQWEWVYQVEPDKPGLQQRMESALREEGVEYDFKGDSSRNFHVTYNKKAERRLVRDVLKILEAAYKDVGRALDFSYPPTPIQVTLYTSKGFSESTQMGEHVGAIYDGTKIRCPVLDENGNTIEHDELKRRLYHEYVHVVVRHLARNNAAWWLNEGLAETLSRDLAPHELASLRKANVDQNLFRLEDLEVSPLNTLEVERLRVAYYQSHASVEFLKRKQGFQSIADVLRDVGNGEASETSLRAHCRYSYHTLELAVANFISQQSR